MPTELTDPEYVNPAGGSGAGVVALEVANQAARLALVGPSTRAAVAQLDDDSVWALVTGGNPTVVGDWKLIGRRSIRFLGSVANQAAMLLLSAGRKGDWCHRSDLNRRFDLTGASPSTLAHWTAELEKSVADVGGLAGALHQRLRINLDFVGLTGGQPNKLDSLPTEGASKLPAGTIVRLDTTVYGIADYVLRSNDGITETLLPFLVMPADHNPEGEDMVWVMAPANVFGVIEVWTLGGLGGFINLHNNAGNGGVNLHAKNCPAGTLVAEIVKGGTFAMTSDLAGPARVSVTAETSSLLSSHAGKLVTFDLGTEQALNVIAGVPHPFRCELLALENDVLVAVVGVGVQINGYASGSVFRIPQGYAPAARLTAISANIYSLEGATLEI